MSSRGNHTQTSVVMRTEHLQRLDQIVAEQEIPSRNALFQAIAATVTPDQARQFYDLAVEQGLMRKGSTAEERELRKAVSSMTAEQLKRAVSAV